MRTISDLRHGGGRQRGDYVAVTQPGERVGIEVIAGVLLGLVLSVWLITWAIKRGR
jgi:hypothetical protein